MNFRRLAVISFVTLAAGLAARRWLATPIYVASDSMAPTLNVGHHLVLDRVTYLFREPRRGEVISFTQPGGDGHGMVKRVIAVGGDTVELRAKRVYLNQEAQYEPYAYYARPGETLEGDDLGPFQVPPGNLFVLGDNRDRSYDSSSWKDPSTGAPSPFLPLTAVNGKIRGAY